MRADDIPNAVGQEHKCRGGYSLRVSAHVAGGELQGQHEGGYEGADLLSYSSLALILLSSEMRGKIKKKEDGAYDIIPKQHPVFPLAR